MLSRESFRFFADLARNNNKDWFHRNRDRYQKFVRHPMKALAEDLEDPVSLILPEFSGQAKVSRINNDIRFSPNKPLYKERVWISFGAAGGICSNLFAGIDREGWTTGAGIGAPKREALDLWRRNLIDHFATWQRYAAAIGLGRSSIAHLENPYKKPLYDDTPDEVFDLVQARGAWLVDAYQTTFDRSPVEEFFRGVCKFLPAYLFMTVPAEKLSGRLRELSQEIIAPDAEIDQIWRVLRSP